MHSYGALMLHLVTLWYINVTLVHQDGA